MTPAASASSTEHDLKKNQLEKNVNHRTYGWAGRWRRNWKPTIEGRKRSFCEQITNECHLKRWKSNKQTNKESPWNDHGEVSQCWAVTWKIRGLCVGVSCTGRVWNKSDSSTAKRSLSSYYRFLKFLSCLKLTANIPKRAEANGKLARYWGLRTFKNTAIFTVFQIPPRGKSGFPKDQKQKKYPQKPWIPAVTVLSSYIDSIVDVKGMHTIANPTQTCTFDGESRNTS